jgi:hypothetical protein
MADATIMQVKEFFGVLPGQTLKDFTNDWKALPDDAKAQIRAGIGNGSFTY